MCKHRTSDKYYMCYVCNKKSSKVMVHQPDISSQHSDYSDWVYLSDLSNSIFADTFFNALDRFIFLMLGMSKFCARCIWVILIQIFLPIYCLGKAQFLKPSFSRTKVLHVQLCIFGCWLSFLLISRFIVMA